MILFAVLLPACLGIFDFWGWDNGVPGEFRQRFHPGGLPFLLRRNDNAALAGRAIDLPSGKAELTFDVLTAINTGELEVGFHDLPAFPYKENRNGLQVFSLNC